MALGTVGCATSDGVARGDAVHVGVGGTSGAGTGTNGTAGVVPGGGASVDGTSTGTVALGGAGGSEAAATVTAGAELGGGPAQVDASAEPTGSGPAAGGSGGLPGSVGATPSVDVAPADGLGGGDQSGEGGVPILDSGSDAGGGGGASGADVPSSDAGTSQSAYNPCPTDGGPCTILPLGDSITYGDKSSDTAGYRSHLYKLILASNQKVTFTGSRSDGPAQVSGQPFPRMHEGHPGWTIDPGYNTNPAFDGGISQLIPSPALDGNPHIILLCIGTNDLFARDTANMAARLDVLLDDIVANAPSSLIVLAQITPLRDANAALTAYNESIPEMIQNRAAMGQHIIGVDMSTLPDSGLHSDGTHPNDEGYAYMADVWYAAIADLLPE